MQMEPHSSSQPNNANSTNNNTHGDNKATIPKPVPVIQFLHQLLQVGSDTVVTPQYTPTIELGASTTINDSNASNNNNNNNQVGSNTSQSENARKRPRDASDQHGPAPKRVKDQNRFQRTAAEQLDGPISNAVPWCGVEVTQVKVQLSLLSLQLPLIRKYFGTSLTPRYALLNEDQARDVRLQACQSLTCTVEWANDTRQRTQDLEWQITPRDGLASTASVSLTSRHVAVTDDWHLHAIFAGFRARVRGPLRIQLSRAHATGEHVLLDVTLSDTCWHQSVTPFTLTRTTQPETLTKLGNIAKYYYEPSVNHCLTLAADTSVTPVTPHLELTFLTVAHMTELLRRSSGEWIEDKPRDSTVEPPQSTQTVDAFADLL